MICELLTEDLYRKEKKMTEHKFTDEEIIRALKLCFALKGTSETCAKCPYHSFGKLCKVERDKDALDLINRQRAEIERLHNILLSFTNEVHTWSNKNGYDTTGLSLIPILNEAESVRETIKAEAVKEFAERLKTYYRNLDRTSGALIEYHIDQIAKEMLEVNEDEGKNT